MPANLTPQYHEAEESFKRATNAQEKEKALQEMLRVIPKHKGTEKMQAELKKRLSKLRKRASPAKLSAPQRPYYFVEREGAGQVVICGPPNAGKSTLVAGLTEAKPEVADYPFTTRVPSPGMMQFEDVQVQLVDTPPLAPEVLEPWQLTLWAQADARVLIFDVNDPQLLEQTAFVHKSLASKALSLSAKGPSAPLVLANKVDLPKGKENLEAWLELEEEPIQVVPISLIDDRQLQDLRRVLFQALGRIRVYTKRPGYRLPTDSAPFLLPQGSTVLEAASAVHKDLARRFRYARLWGQARFEGQMVEREHVLEDGDLIEIHTG